jgi:hypothetical protein
MYVCMYVCMYVPFSQTISSASMYWDSNQHLLQKKKKIEIQFHS